jgi:AcrR family transcriptional regulator
VSKRPPDLRERRAAREARARERIVEAFTERARTAGPRSVVMAELAHDLGISTRTLYKHFRSKAELVHEVVGRFAEEWRAGQRRRFAQRLPAVERIREVALAWLEVRDRFSATFWRETRQHYPEAFAVWSEAQRALWSRARQGIRPAMRDDVPKPLSAAILLEAIGVAADPDRCDRLGLSRQEAVMHAVALWARGALERADPCVVPDAEPESDG